MMSFDVRQFTIVSKLGCFRTASLLAVHYRIRAWCVGPNIDVFVHAYA